MKTMDEKSALAPVLAVPVPVLVLDEEEAIEDLAVTICAFSAPAIANPATAQQGAPASFCCNCGQALAAGGTPSARSAGPCVALPPRRHSPWQRR